MKYVVLSFIVGLVLAACNAKQSNNERTSGSDSTAKTSRVIFIKDSVFDPTLRKLMEGKNIEAISVDNRSWAKSKEEVLAYISTQPQNKDLRLTDECKVEQQN